MHSLRLTLSVTIIVALSLLVLTGAELEPEQEPEQEEELVSYEGHKVLNVFLRNESDAQLVRQLEEDGADLWSQHLYKLANATLLLPPKMQHLVIKTLRQLGVPHWIIHQDFQQVIDAERAERTERTEHRERDVKPESEPELVAEPRIVGTFARYSSIESWLKQVASSCGNVCVLEEVGKSYGGRQMYVMRIGYNVKKGTNLPRIFTDSTIHAREWLAQAAHIWVINKMITSYEKDKTIGDALKQYEFNFMVVANPDGYEFTHTNDRMWRKTRSPNTGSKCVGVDPNRNFDYGWGGEGTSNNPCSDIYRGTKAFSEAETKVLSDYVLRYKSSMRAYIALHTYCQMLLVPYGHKSNAFPPDYNELLRVASAMSSAMRSATNKNYQAGNTAALLSPGAGGSDDWAKGTVGVKYSYTIELRPTRNTPNGFVVSASEISPAGTELLAAFITLTKEMQPM